MGWDRSGRIARKLSHLGSVMTIAYNQDDLRMEVDEDSVTLYLYDINRIEMTRYEFEKLMEAYDGKD